MATFAVSSAETVLLRVRGVVQGVGFRPFGNRLAQELGVSGWVLNDPEGVLIQASAIPEMLERFILSDSRTSSSSRQS